MRDVSCILSAETGWGTQQQHRKAVKTGFTPEVTLRKSGVEGSSDLASPYVVCSCLHAQWSRISGLVGGGDKDLSQGVNKSSWSRAVKALGVGGVSQIWYSNWSLSTGYIEFIYGDGVRIVLNMDEGRDGGEVKPELCPQSNTAAVESKKWV